MKNHFTAAIMGNGLFSALRRATSSRFSSIRALVMIPSKSEKLELQVTHDARSGDDMVKLTRSNWRTGEETQLYNGIFTGGAPIRKRMPRD